MEARGQEVLGGNPGLSCDLFLSVMVILLTLCSRGHDVGKREHPRKLPAFADLEGRAKTNTSCDD